MKTWPQKTTSTGRWRHAVHSDDDRIPKPAEDRRLLADARRQDDAAGVAQPRQHQDLAHRRRPGPRTGPGCSGRCRRGRRSNRRPGRGCERSRCLRPRRTGPAGLPDAQRPGARRGREVDVVAGTRRSPRCSQRPTGVTKPVLRRSRLAAGNGGAGCRRPPPWHSSWPARRPAAAPPGRTDRRRARGSRRECAMPAQSASRRSWLRM